MDLNQTLNTSSFSKKLQNMVDILFAGKLSTND